MAPSLLVGDLVLLLPLAPRAGDVVAVVDPLDPSRWTLRRVEAIGGSVRYSDGVFFSSNEESARVLEMSRDTESVVRKERDHLVRLAPTPVRWSLAEVGVPDDAAFLGADARDEATDSRWWGPVPLDAVQGVVAARIGAPGHPWRTWIAGRGG
jgi:signal peptidase I